MYLSVLKESDYFQKVLEKSDLLFPNAEKLFWKWCWNVAFPFPCCNACECIGWHLWAGGEVGQRRLCDISPLLGDYRSACGSAVLCVGHSVIYPAAWQHLLQLLWGGLFCIPASFVYSGIPYIATSRSKFKVFCYTQVQWNSSMNFLQAIMPNKYRIIGPEASNE